MYCIKCGAETSDSQFCRKCGTPVSGVVSAGGGAAAALAPQKKKVRVSFIIAAAFFFVVLGMFLYAHQMNTIQGNKQPHTQTFSNDALVVNHLGYKDIELNVPPNAVNVRLEGNFTAHGGSGNDIEIFLLGHNDFINWQKGHPSRAYYSSGKTTVGNIQANLPPGNQYVLVISNKFSLFTDKTVAMHTNLTYYQ